MKRMTSGVNEHCSTDGEHRVHSTDDEKNPWGNRNHGVYENHISSTFHRMLRTATRQHQMVEIQLSCNKVAKITTTLRRIIDMVEKPTASSHRVLMTIIHSKRSASLQQWEVLRIASLYSTVFESARRCSSSRTWRQ